MADSTPVNPFDAGVDQVLHTDAQNTAVQIRSNLNSSLGTNPDQSAQQQSLAKTVGLPLQTVQAQPDAAKQMASQKSMDTGSLVTNYPTLASYLADPNNMAKSHDDIAPLAAVESAAKALPTPPPTAQAPSFGQTLLWIPGDVVSGLGGSFNKAIGSVNLALGAVPTVYDKVASLISGKPTTSAEDAYFSRFVDPRINAQSTFEPAPNAPFLSKAANTAGSLLGTLSQISLTGGGGEAAAGAETAAGMVGQAVEHGAKSMAFPALSDAVDTGRKVYQATGDGAQAMRAAQMQYLASTAQGVVPLSAPGGLATRLAGGFAAGAASGEASRAAMNLVLPTSMQQPFDPENTILSGLSGSILGGVMGPRGEPVFHDAIRQTYTDASKADAAVQGAQSLQDLSDMAASSATRARDPEGFKALVQNMTEDGKLQDVYVDANQFANVLNQSGVSIAKLAETMPDVAAQFPEAVQTNGDIRIPVADYATHIAGGPVDAALLPHLKVDPDGFTSQQGQEYFQNQQAQMQEQAQKILSDQQVDEATSADAQQVHDQIYGQLQAAGRFNPDVNRQYAALGREFYSTQAERLGVTPSELYAQYPLRVNSEGLVGDTLEQPGTLTPTERAMQSWRDSLARTNMEDPNQVARLPTPAVMKQMGMAQPHLEFPTRYALQVLHDHPDVPRDVFQNLPGLLADPKFVIPHREGGVDVVTDATTEKGEPIVVGVRDGRVRTVTPVHDTAQATGLERVQAAVDKAMGQRGAKVYARDEEAPVKTEASDRAPSATIALRRDSRDMASVLTRAALVKRLGEGFYQPLVPTGDNGLNESLKAEHEAGRITENVARGTASENTIGEGNRGGDRSGAERQVQDRSSGDLNLPARQAHTSLADVEKLWADKGISHSISESDRSISVGKIVLPKESRGQGVGTQAMKELTAYADQQGKRIVLTPATDFGGSSVKRLTKFYKSLGFVENKGKNKDFEISESMYREPQRGTNDALTNPLNVIGESQSGRSADDITMGTDENTGLPLNADGTVTVYHHTSSERAKLIRESGRLTADAEPDVYVTTRRQTDTGYGDTAVPIRVNPDNLTIDDEFPDGRKDFRLNVGKPGGSIKVRVENESTAPGDAGALQQGEGNRAAFNPDTHTISLLKNADLSSYLHESGHFFLETLHDLAAQPDAPGPIKSDFDTLLDWFGVKGTPDTTPAQEWARMSLDEKRQYHEQFAEGFEKYLMDGKAPSLELQPLFSRFRSWLVNVYKSLAGLNVQLTPEVRGVMDRLLASDEAIKQAEQARQYKLLGDTPESMGISLEQFNAYKALGQQATDDAVSDMTARSMRDMKWASNAKGKALKALQREANTHRIAIRQKATSDVMKQPVYQAWQFLTLRGEKDTQAQPDKSGGKASGVAPEKDSLFTAIAKLGGLNRDDVKSQWGVAHKDVPESGIFGKPVLRKSGGLSIDAMAERLQELHYLSDHDLAEFETKFDREKSGDEQFSWQHEYGERPAQSVDLDNTYHGKLSTESLRTMFGEGQDAAWRALSRRGMTSDKVGLDPDIVSDMFGFDSGRDMAEQLASADSPHNAIEALTDQRMLEQHGDLIDPVSVERAAEAAIHNETRAKFMATGLKMLSKSPIPAAQLAKAAKEAADAAIAAKRISDLRPAQHAAAEARANKDAIKLAPTDPRGAVQAQRAALLNNRLYKAASDAVAEVQKALVYLKGFDKASVREKIDLEYRDQIDALLDRFDLRKSVSGTDLAKREALSAFVERMSANGYEPQIPEGLLNEAKSTHYKDMTVEAFRGLVDAVKSIDHLGRMKTTLLDGKEARNIAELANEAKDTMAQLPQRAPESNRGLGAIESKWLSLKSFGRSVTSSLLKVEQMMDWLDNRNPNGVLNRVVFRRIADAGAKEADLQAKVKAQIDALMKTHVQDVTKEKGQIYEADRLIDSATGKPQRFTKKEMLALAGNMGNDSNTAKLVKGEGWDEREVWSFLNQHMGKADWDFVAGMGKAMESLWPEKLAMSRRLGNTNPEKIQPRPFDTPHGKYEGWYWPMVYDPARSQDVAERGAKAGDALFENNYTRANTDTGRTNTRNENYARPLLLSMDVVPRVIRDEIHDIAYREPIIDADKFLSNPKVRESIISALSPEHYAQLRPWLQSIANDSRVDTNGMKWFDQIAHGVRTRATMVGLGYRISTMMVHGGSAAMESIAEVGPTWFAKGLADFANPAQWTANRDFIFERSGEMRNRMNEVDRDIREHLREIDLHLMDPATGAVARGADLMKAHAYQGIAMLDMASALPTWMAAYHKGMAPEAKGGKGLTEQDAVYFADKTVRNAHGGQGIKDQAAVQRGSEFQKLFTMFYTFWNHNINRLADTARMAKDPNTWRDSEKAGTVIMRTLIYTLGIQAMHGLFHPKKDDDGDVNWWKFVAQEMGSAATSGIPIARDLYAYYSEGKDYNATPAASMAQAFGQSSKDAANALTGNQVSDKWLKHTIATAGYTFGLPLGQPSGTVQFLWDVSNGKQNPQDAADWWRGILHGDTKKH